MSPFGHVHTCVLPSCAARLSPERNVCALPWDRPVRCGLPAWITPELEASWMKEHGMFCRRDEVPILGVELVRNRVSRTVSAEPGSLGRWRT